MSSVPEYVAEPRRVVYWIVVGGSSVGVIGLVPPAFTLPSALSWSYRTATASLIPASARSYALALALWVFEPVRFVVA